MRVNTFIVTLISTFFTVAVHADTLIRMKEGSGTIGPDGEPGPGQQVEIWSRPENMARVGPKGRMIFSIDRAMTYLVDDEKKTCRGFPHPKPANVASEAGNLPEPRKTGEVRKVGPWQTEGYELSVTIDGLADPLEVKFWVSKELTSGLDVYRANLAGMATPQTAWMSKTLEYGGYPVYQESRMGSMRSWSEVVSVSENPAPEGIYDIPADYEGCSADGGSADQ